VAIPRRTGGPWGTAVGGVRAGAWLRCECACAGGSALPQCRDAVGGLPGPDVPVVRFAGVQAGWGRCVVVCFRLSGAG